MATFALQTEDKRHLGFLAFANSDGSRPAAGQSDCIFVGPPRDPSLFEDPRGLFVLDHARQEWQVTVTYTQAGMAAHILLDSGWAFELRSNEAGSFWSAQRGDETVSGTGRFL